MICGICGVKQSGFTLIEIIVTVVIVAILGSMTLTFLSKSLVDSSEPVKRFQRVSNLNKIMANITADYNRYPKWRSGVLYTTGNNIVPTTRNGHYYVCTTPGVSGTIEPVSWPVTSVSTVNDGGVIWTENGTLPLLSTLQGAIGTENSDQNNSYGIYHVVKNRFVIFNSSGTEEDDTTGYNKILKVIISNEQGETLTALFISN